jgi:toxin-antitoxin system PIN domain toxin
LTIYLLDTNVLIALFDPAHVHHDAAHAWFERRGAAWATCPLTENGFVRIVSHPRYPSFDVTPAEAIEALDEFTAARPGHVFWPDDASLRDDGLFARAAFRRPADVTDAYLLGLAVRRGGRLATFDRALRPATVRGATESAIERIPAG